MMLIYIFMLLCREKEKHQLAGDKHGRQWQEKKDLFFFLPFFPFLCSGK